MALLLLPFIRRAEDNSGSGSRFVSKISYPHNFVNFALRDMCGTSMNSCDERLYFVYYMYT